MTLFCSAVEFDALCRDIAGRAERVRLQAKGGSMYPFIRSGDWVELVLAGETARAGDIVLFRKDGSLYLHRLLGRSARGFLAKGDMSFGCDGVIPGEDIIGRAIAVIRGNRRIDLCTRANRSIAACAAACSIAAQYPVALLHAAAESGVRGFVRLQGLKAYRRAVKTLTGAAIAVREARDRDEEALRDIYRMSGQDIREGLARAGSGFWLIAERGGRAIGGVTAYPCENDGGLWIIWGLEVKPLFRGQGAGRMLVREALAKIKEKGGDRTGLFVNRSSRAALRLYRGLGFRDDREPPEFNRGEREIYLSYGADGQ